MPELDQLKSRSVVLVSGFIQDVDQKPKLVKVSTPFRRFAVVINTSYPEFPGGYFFDHDLVLKICEAVVQGRSTQVRGFPKDAQTLDALEAAWRAGCQSDERDDPSNNELFEELLALEGGEIILHIRGIDWHAVGGPAPYHDSATLEVFAPEAQADVLFQRVRAAASEAGAEVQVMQGCAAAQVPAWRPLRDVLSRTWVLLALGALGGLLFALVKGMMSRGAP